MKNQEKLKEVLKLIGLFFLVVLIITLLSAFRKKDKKEEKIKYREKEIFEKKESKNETKKLFPDLNDNSIREINIDSNEAEGIKEGRLRLDDLGNIEAEFDGYKNIFREGIEVKSAMGEIIAAKFSKKYNKPVIGGIKPDTSGDELEKKLGKPNLKHENIYLYILDGIDVLFNLDEAYISVYKNKEQDSLKYYDIIERYKKFLKEKDLKKFIADLTKINPRYYRYDYDNDYVVLDYIDLGLRIKFTKDGKTDGIYLFDNFLKSANYNKEDIDEMSFKSYIYKENKRLSFVEELFKKDERKKRSKKAKEIYDIAKMEINGERSADIPEDIELYYEINEEYTEYKNVIIKSKSDSFPTHLINESGTVNFLTCMNNKIIYSLEYEGIYEVNLDGSNLKKIYDPEDNEKIVVKLVEISKNKILFNNKELIID